MLFFKNPEIEIMTLDDGDVIAFDPATGDTHFLNTIAADILRLLDEPKDLNTMIALLSAEYDTDAATIRADVEPFLAEMREKNILKCPL